MDGWIVRGLKKRLAKHRADCATFPKLVRSCSNSGWRDFVAEVTPTEPGPPSADVRLVPLNPDPTETEKFPPSHWPVRLSVTVGG